MSLYADDVGGRAASLDPVVAARAKLQIGRSGRHIGQESIQMHGGIGLTDEYPVGHYVSRLTAIEHTLGRDRRSPAGTQRPPGRLLARRVLTPFLTRLARPLCRR